MAIKVEGMIPLLQVFDMPRALGFYRDVLGFVVENQSSPGDDFDWGMLRLDDVKLMLNTAYEMPHRPAAPPAHRVAAHQDAGLFFLARDVDAVFEHLRAHGVEVDPPKVAPYGMKQLYVKDPDGFELCFQWPASADHE